MKSHLGMCALMLSLLCTATGVAAEDQLPIIDIHLHSYDDNEYFVAPDQYGKMSPQTANEHFVATYESMRRHNIVLGVVSGSVSSRDAWIARDTDGRLLRGFSSSNLPDITPDAFEALVKKARSTCLER